MVDSASRSCCTNLHSRFPREAECIRCLNASDSWQIIDVDDYVPDFELNPDLVSPLALPGDTKGAIKISSYCLVWFRHCPPRRREPAACRWHQHIAYSQTRYQQIQPQSIRIICLNKHAQILTGQQLMNQLMHRPTTPHLAFRFAGS